MNLRQAVLDSLRCGAPLAKISEHHSVSEHDILQIVANEMSARIPNHLVEYLKLQDMEDLWAESATQRAMPPMEAYSMLKAQRERFHLAMEKEIRRVSGVNGHPEVRNPVEAFKKIIGGKDEIAAPPPSRSPKAKRKGKK